MNEIEMDLYNEIKSRMNIAYMGEGKKPIEAAKNVTNDMFLLYPVSEIVKNALINHCNYLAKWY